jgi:hypothetical protein
MPVSPPPPPPRRVVRIGLASPPQRKESPGSPSIPLQRERVDGDDAEYSSLEEVSFTTPLALTMTALQLSKEEGGFEASLLKAFRLAQKQGSLTSFFCLSRLLFIGYRAQVEASYFYEQNEAQPTSYLFFTRATRLSSLLTYHMPLIEALSPGWTVRTDPDKGEVWYERGGECRWTLPLP